MIGPMKIQHIRMIATLVMLIGAFLLFSMIFIAFQSGASLSGIALKMFVAGLVAGGVITILGGVLFTHPSLGQLGTIDY